MQKQKCTTKLHLKIKFLTKTEDNLRSSENYEECSVSKIQGCVFHLYLLLKNAV